MIVSAEGIPRDPELSGGEEVRMCNPCVPDPNNEPPPQRRGHQVEEEDEGATTGSTRASLSRRNRDVYVIDQLDENSGARVEQVGPVYMGGGDVSIYITSFYDLFRTSSLSNLWKCFNFHSPVSYISQFSINGSGQFPSAKTNPYIRARIH